VAGFDHREHRRAVHARTANEYHAPRRALRSTYRRADPAMMAEPSREFLAVQRTTSRDWPRDLSRRLTARPLETPSMRDAHGRASNTSASAGDGAAKTAVVIEAASRTMTRRRIRSLSSRSHRYFTPESLSSADGAQSRLVAKNHSPQGDEFHPDGWSNGDIHFKGGTRDQDGNADQ
jgi:hypothetical protein